MKARNSRLLLTRLEKRNFMTIFIDFPTVNLKFLCRKLEMM